MEIPWVQILVVALTSSAFTTGMLAMLLFAGKSLIERWLARNLEKFKVDLQLAAFEHQTRFTKLHEKRTEVIAGLYKRLVQIQYSLDSLAKEKEIPIFEPEKVKDKERIARESLVEFGKYFVDHRLYFTESLCGTIEKFHSQSGEAWRELLIVNWSQDERMKSILDRLAKQIPSLRREIEKEFRKMLGVE